MALISLRQLLDNGGYEYLRGLLRGTGDVERILARVALKSARPRDLVALADALARLPGVQQFLSLLDASLLQQTVASPMRPWEAALAEYQRALNILVQHSGRQHPLTTMTLRNWASLLYDSGQFREAAVRYGEALSLVEQRFGAEDPRLLDSLATVVMARVPMITSNESQIGMSTLKPQPWSRWYSCSACRTSLTPMNARMNDRPTDR